MPDAGISAAVLTALPFMYFLMVASITPGPNNVMLAASGMNFGYTKTVPHILGILFGFCTLLLLCAFGVGALYQAYPPIQMALKVGGSLYLLYLAWRIATAGRAKIDGETEKGRPLTFIEAALFQYVNPKAWVMGVAACSTFLPVDMPVMGRVLVIVVTVATVCAISTHVWALFGSGAMARLFTSDKWRRVINMGLAVLLVATIPMMVL